ncbi:MAG: protein-tyrosine-phosphatase [Chitinophagales bacterium]|nr:MAG: protein-tyrosine-phosphatase [Chitinophagales bacterium]
MKILFVCLGNICRSPLAEGIMRNKIQQYNLNWEVDSAGTSAWHAGEPPDPRAIAIAARYGIDISRLRARQFSPYDFERFDRIYVMDSDNLQNVLRMALSEKEKQKVSLVLHTTHPASGQEVPDPYYDDDGFESVFRLLDAACEAIIKQYADAKIGL